MKMGFILWVLLAFWPSLIRAEQQAQPVYYIGFNQLIADKNGENAKVFGGYIDDLKPIMARYGLTLRTFKVVHGGQHQRLGASAITFGTAPDQESFARFFADADFQALFPTLVGIIETHTVVFTPEQLDAHLGGDKGAILLSAAWLSESTEDSKKALLKLEDGTQHARQRYGVALSGRTQGVMANRGLAGPMERVRAPDVLALWRLDNPHGYLDDPTVQGFSKASKPYIEDHAMIWLQPW